MSQEYPILPLRSEVLMPASPAPIGVGRDKSVELLEDLMDDGKVEFVAVAQKEEDIEDPTADDIYDVGTKVEIAKVIRNGTGNGYTAIVRGVERVRLDEVTQEEPYFKGEFETFEEELGTDDEGEIEDLTTALKETTLDVIQAEGEIPVESSQSVKDLDDPSDLTDFIVSHSGLDKDRKQEFLEMDNIKERLEEVISLLTERKERTQVAREIRERVQQQNEETQREFLLRQQLKAIKEQLGEAHNDVDELEQRVEASNMPQEAYEEAMKQLDRLRTMQPNQSNYAVTLTYVETLCDVPWGEVTVDNLDLSKAQEVLDEDHYGLDEVKSRIIEFLGVRQLKSDTKSPILCLVGPPGVGKTSLGKSIANTLGREFQRISLGGVDDESEIRGHRRTYVGSLPGRITRALINAETMNPVVMLDEIDKVGNNFRGDPASALLEVLDPEQNDSFKDHYLGVDLDLSKVLFVCTANTLETVSPPLKDRMETLEVPSYTLYEKMKIAEQFLLPKQIREHGIEEDNVDMGEDSLKYVIDKYTREAGVRELERKLASLCRSVALQVAKKGEDDRSDVKVEIDRDYIQDALGPEEHISEMAKRENQVGVATGLAWTKAGGDILFIEAQMMQGDGDLKLTGQLGDVMKESVHAALSYIRSRAAAFGIESDFNKDRDMHLHVPAGAIPKDGPSAGITMFAALLSRLTGTKIRKDVAMTGEITLSGDILPVGGIKEKVVAAHRAGVKEVILPEICEKDLVDIEDDVKEDLEFHFVEKVSELPDLVFEDHSFNMDLPDEAFETVMSNSDGRIEA